MRLIDADKLPYEDIESIDGNTYMCVNAYDIEHAPTIEQSEDCISREDAIKVVKKWFDKIELNSDICIDGLISLPPVTPKRKVGKWIDEGQYAEGHSHHAYECSECGNHIIELKPDDFCKFCGADMRGEEE